MSPPRPPKGGDEPPLPPRGVVGCVVGWCRRVRGRDVLILSRRGSGWWFGLARATLE